MLNPNFGNGGIVTTPFLGMGAQAKAVAVQPDGKIVVAGSAFASNSIDEDFAVARYNADGSLDDNFGAHGIVTVDLGTDNDFATGLAIESDGKIVVGGNAGEDVGLVRLLPNGTLDITFGNLGKSVTKIGLGADVNGVALDSDGGIRIAGSTVGAISQNHDFLLAGFKADGTLNLGFGHFGFVTTDFGTETTSPRTCWSTTRVKSSLSDAPAAARSWTWRSPPTSPTAHSLTSAAVASSPPISTGGATSARTCVIDSRTESSPRAAPAAAAAPSSR